MKDEIKIITLGDIFENLETEDKAFKFLKYIKELQQENERLLKKSYSDDVRITKAIERIEKFNKDEGLTMYVDTAKHLDTILDILKGE